MAPPDRRHGLGRGNRSSRRRRGSGWSTRPRSGASGRPLVSEDGAAGMSGIQEL